MNYEDALEYMDGRLRLGIKLGNERFEALLHRLGDPQESLRVIHVAGTKGKGSTVAMAASVLTAAGYKVGQYMSPYVYDVRERVQINGVMISKENFARWVMRMRPHIEALEATEYGATTEFELKTALGLCWFAEQNVDYTVLEVGLGGRLDATNVIRKPLVSVITNIGFDHTELLGDTLGKIAGEKAGIVKLGVPCVTGVPVGEEADMVISQICRERDAPLTHVTNDPALSSEYNYAVDTDGRLAIRTPRRRLDGLRLRLRGEFQHANAAVAVAALDTIYPDALASLPNEAVRRGLEAAYAPGRLEKVREQPTIVLDVAHNALAGTALTRALREEYNASTRRLIFVVGLSRHHDPETFLEPLAGLHPAALIATQPKFRPRDAQDVATAARRWDVSGVQTVASGVKDAVQTALALAGPDDIICVTGSFYTVGDIPQDFWMDAVR